MDRLATYLVIGVPNSGTSLIAGTLHHMGIPMGTRWNVPGKYEDADFYEAINDESKVIDLIIKRTSQHKVWGMKYLPIWRQIWSVLHAIPNPHFVLAYRSITEIVAKHPERCVMTLLKIYGVWGVFFELYKFPIFIIDYNESIHHPERLVRKLAKFCDITLTHDKVVEVVKFNTQGTRYNDDYVH